MLRTRTPRICHSSSCAHPAAPCVSAVKLDELPGCMQSLFKASFMHVQTRNRPPFGRMRALLSEIEQRFADPQLDCHVSRRFTVCVIFTRTLVCCISWLSRGSQPSLRRHEVAHYHLQLGTHRANHYQALAMHRISTLNLKLRNDTPNPDMKSAGPVLLGRAAVRPCGACGLHAEPRHRTP